MTEKTPPCDGRGAEAVLSAMDRKIEMVWLLAFYGALLTENQLKMMRLYYEEDLSLAEIAQQACVSRQSVHDTLQRAGQQLISLEEKLGLKARFQKQEAMIARCLDSLSHVRPSEETKPYLTMALKTLGALKGEEET